MNKKQLGKKVNIARKDCGLTGEKLAEACHINPTYLRQIESGTKIPSLPVFVTICKDCGFLRPTCFLRSLKTVI